LETPEIFCDVEHQNCTEVRNVSFNGLGATNLTRIIDLLKQNMYSTYEVILLILTVKKLKI